MALDLTAPVAAFKVAWEAADAKGKAGHRTEAGMAAAAPIIEAQVREELAARFAERLLDNADEDDYTYGAGWLAAMRTALRMTRGEL